MTHARIALIIALLALPVAAARPPVTFENAPDILKRMTLTDDEFRGLINVQERYEAGYCTGNMNGLGERGQKDGRQFLRGLWETDRKTKKPDHEYRPGPISYTKAYKGKPYPYSFNPRVATSTTVMRYWPLKQPWPVKNDRPAKRIDLRVTGRINHASSDKIAEILAKDEARVKGDIAKKIEDRHYEFKRDLGFGLDRNSMECFFGVDGMNGQVQIWLQRGRDFTSVEVNLTYDQHAITPKAAKVLARNAAAIVSNRVFGTAAKVERPVGQAGIVDAYTASNLGKTPTEDRRETKFKMGSQFYVAVAYRPEVVGARCRITVTFKPSAATVETSRQLMRHSKSSSMSMRTPLDAIEHDLQYIELSGAGGVDEMTMSKTNSTPFTKSLGNGLRVVYVKVPTDNTIGDLWKGPGRWEVLINMHEYRGDGDDTVELATQKLDLDLVATPTYYKESFTDLDPKTGEPKGN